jgi:hypothetical protein
VTFCVEAERTIYPADSTGERSDLISGMDIDPWCVREVSEGRTYWQLPKPSSPTPRRGISPIGRVSK